MPATGKSMCSVIHGPHLMSNKTWRACCARVGGVAKDGGLSNSRRLQRFTFDASFGGAAAQAAVYAEVASVVASVLDAYNVCIFAYGQTGSGKVSLRAYHGIVEGFWRV